MNRCTFGLHKWVEKWTHKSQPKNEYSGVFGFKGDVCHICGKHRYNFGVGDSYGLIRVNYPDTRKN